MKDLVLPDPASTLARVPKQTISSPIQSASLIRSHIPLSERGRVTVEKTRMEIRAILEGRDKERMLVLCGPCSIDDVNAALVYGERIRKLSKAVDDKVLLVMRTYFEKPRSVVGWKGLLYESLDEGASNPSCGISLARRLVTRLNAMGVPTATEFLNPLLSTYLEDCMAYGSIGSRTVESQIHREMASGMELPIGMKNAMDGNTASALNAVNSAQSEHTFYGQDLNGSPVCHETNGNPGAHVILRGGAGGPNFDSENVDSVVAAGQKLGLERPVVIDCSHGNSGKDHRRQRGVFENVLSQFQTGQRGIAGLMLESYLVEGRQDAEAGTARVFGQSITDSCIDWANTESIVKELASTL